MDRNRDEKRGEGSGQTSTEPVAPNAAGGASLLQPGVTLTFYYGGGPETARLVPDQSLVIGRRAPADIRIPEPSLSKVHARFTLRDDGILVEDLGSLNGVRSGDHRIERGTIGFGAEVMLGTVIVRVSTFGMTRDPILVGEAAFHKRLDEELERARYFHQRPLAILAVRAGEAESQQAPSGVWVWSLFTRLQPIDRVCLYTPSMALVLLPESERETAEKVAGEIAANEPDRESPRFVGLAVYPKTATTTDKLVELAREAAERAHAEHRVILAPMEPWTENIPPVDDNKPFFGTSAKIREMLREVKQASKTHVNVLLFGETGTGKEIVARYLYENGLRNDKPYNVVNCGAIQPTLIQSTFFGHEKGSFTGAMKQQQGFFEATNGGTLFLDEIGELSSDAQSALLRVIESGRFTRVGSTREVQVDVQIIAATHRNLEAMVKEGRFRDDLLSRLSTMVVTIPPLRERRDEIEPLCQRFLAKANKKHRRSVQGITKKAIDVLRAYDWPRNVRELQGAIERAVVVVAEGDQIRPEDLPAHVREAQHEPEDPPAPLKEDLTRTEKQRIEEALEKAGGVQARAAELLDMHPRTLSNKIKKLGIEVTQKPRQTPGQK
jgi:DNA-binding NtrC family response regulator